MPDPSQAFLTFLRSKHELLKCNKMVGMPAETYIGLSKSCSEAVINSLNQVQLNEQVLAEVTNEIANGPLCDGDKISVMSVVNARASTSMIGLTNTTSRAQIQTNNYIFQYMTQQDWQCFEKGTMAEKIRCMATRAIEIGMRHPSEKSFALMATVMCSRGASPQPGPETLNIVRDLKALHRSMTAPLCARPNHDRPENCATFDPLIFPGSSICFMFVLCVGECLA
jgi:hypothetical protein